MNKYNLMFDEMEQYLESLKITRKDYAAYGLKEEKHKLIDEKFDELVQKYLKN